MLKLFNVVTLDMLVHSRTTRVPFTLPVLTGGTNQLAIEYQALSGLSLPQSGWEILPVGGYSLEIGIYAADGTTQLAYQNSFTGGSTDDIYRGTLNLTDAAMISALSAITPDEELTAYMEIRRTDSTGRPITGLSPTAVRIKKGIITTASVTVAPTEQGATQSWVLSNFQPREGDGTPRIEVSPSGIRWAVWIDDNGDYQKQRLN
jgi:hypothetical protein